MRPRIFFRFAAGSVLLSALTAPLIFAQSPTPSSADPDAAFIAELKKQIAGREQEPAETVYKNIQMLKGVPAARLLGIMKIGYAGSLGVHCEHCHDTRNWAGDDKAEKKVARQMIQMMRDINDRQLKSMTGLKSEKPVVNCTTCHRGQVKPALDSEPAPGTGN